MGDHTVITDEGEFFLASGDYQRIQKGEAAMVQIKEAAPPILEAHKEYETALQALREASGKLREVWWGEAGKVYDEHGPQTKDDLVRACLGRENRQMLDQIEKAREQAFMRVEM